MKDEKVVIESPLAGDIKETIEDNLKYACGCMHDCLTRGEAPFASHLLYTQEGILDDNLPEERTRGITAGRIWACCADRCVVYIDRGVTGGMWQGMIHAYKHDIPIEIRMLPNES